MKLEYQVSDHGAGKISVQVFDREDGGKLVADEAILKDIDGWRIAGTKYDRPQHKTPDAAAQHFTRLLADEMAAAK